MPFPLAIPLALGLLAQAPFDNGPEERAARLDFMKRSLAEYDLRPAGEDKVSLRLQAEPVLRFTNPVGESQDGAIFFWVDADGRPQAAVQAFLMRRTLWIHDFSSLSAGPLVAELHGRPAWRPSRGGVSFQPVPDAPPPAETPTARLRQMRDLAEGFAVSDDFRRKGWQVLRPMPRPFARYGKAGSHLVDGAVFCFALGTDPEAYLMLEARDGAGGPEWQYAFAPQTIYPLKATWKGQEVWGQPYLQPVTASDPFFGRTFQPEEYPR